MRTLLPCLLATVLAACAADGVPDSHASSASFSPSRKADGEQPIVFASAQTTTSLLADASGERLSEEDVAALFADAVQPPLTEDEAPLAPWTYLRAISALGYYGPLGPYGPLGTLGPIGDGAWSPELYISGSFGWADWSDDLTDAGGPLGPDGPLGTDGPLDPSRWMMPDTDVTGGFVRHLVPGGVFAAVGPVGLLGPVGPLGPLGPVGAHGYLRGEGGGYWPEEGECHHVPPEHAAPPCRVIGIEREPGGEPRLFELFERYDEEQARAMEDNDTSFLVQGSVDVDRPDRFAFHSREEQWVTVLVVPEQAKYPFVQAMGVLRAATWNGWDEPAGAFVPHLLTGAPTWQFYDHQASFDDFDLAITVDGQVVRSSSGDHVDWIQIHVPAGTAIEAEVSLFRAWEPAPQDRWWGLFARPGRPTYRLYVVGSTSDGVGPHSFEGGWLRWLE